MTSTPEPPVRVLLVSQNPRVSQHVATAFVGDPDVELVEVRTPERALALLDEGQRFAVVIGDADTAPSGGFVLSRDVKARGQMGRLMPPVVLLLARIQDAYLSNWSQADAYVLKPVDPFNLREVVAAVVAGDPLPQLPGVGGEPVPSLLDLPGEAQNVVQEAGQVAGGLTGGGP